MKKENKTLLIHAICWLLLCIFCLTVKAQKLPAVQQGGLRAPTNVKTDGKANEWGNQLEAYNPSTQVYYTIGNSDDKLYLTVQVKEAGIINKILIGGITFTTNLTGKKADKEGVNITFPVLKKEMITSIAIKLREPLTAVDSAGKARQMDSLVRLMNEDIGSKTKEIGLKGMKTLSDSLISVYNVEGIKAVIKFDQHKALIYELSVPLKYLGLAVKDQSAFHYNVMLNGLDRTDVVIYPPGSRIAMVTSLPRGVTTSGVNSMSFTFPTDFWGEYTLK
jgi:hypothetical protein